MNGPPRTSHYARVPIAAAAAVLLASAAAVAAAAQETPQASERTGRQIFLETCAACHAPDGKGHSRSRLGFDVAPPDFTDPDFVSREPHADWVWIAHRGGPVRGFSEIMPSFGEALTRDELSRAVTYAKSFADTKRWPPGEFNLPRALFTGKAFLEDEIVLQANVSRSEAGLDSIGGKLVYEQRFGARNMWEIVVPFGWSERFVWTGELGDPYTPWGANLGDIALAVKRCFYHNLRGGSILSGAAEIILPTGDRRSGFGKETFIFEPFLAFGQILPADFFLQAQAGLELPFSRAYAENEAFLRVALGKEVRFKPWGRTWSPMVEVLAAKELVAGERIVLDAVPQIQVTLNKRQHVRLNVGVRLPLNETSGRRAAVVAYLLWDWFDGGFFDGW